MTKAMSGGDDDGGAPPSSSAPDDDVFGGWLRRRLTGAANTEDDHETTKRILQSGGAGFQASRLTSGMLLNASRALNASYAYSILKGGSAPFTPMFSIPSGIASGYVSYFKNTILSNSTFTGSKWSVTAEEAHAHFARVNTATRARNAHHHQTMHAQTMASMSFLHVAQGMRVACAAKTASDGCRWVRCECWSLVL